MQYKDKIRMLKRVPQMVIKQFGINRMHFTDFVEKAEDLGLIYIGERLTSQSITAPCPLPAYEGRSIRTETKELIEIGSKDFFDFHMADAYIGSECGCAFRSSDYFNRIPTELLKYGQIFYTIALGSDCGREFLSDYAQIPYDLRVEFNDLLDSGVLNMPLEERVVRMRHFMKTLFDLPSGLARRLHIMPI